MEPYLVDDLTQAVEKLWNDQELRNNITTLANKQVIMHLNTFLNKQQETY